MVKREKSALRKLIMRHRGHGWSSGPTPWYFDGLIQKGF
jgi:hypothetical protein